MRCGWRHSQFTSTTRYGHQRRTQEICLPWTGQPQWQVCLRLLCCRRSCYSKWAQRKIHYSMAPWRLRLCFSPDERRCKSFQTSRYGDTVPTTRLGRRQVRHRGGLARGDHASFGQCRQTTLRAQLLGDREDNLLHHEEFRPSFPANPFWNDRRNSGDHFLHTRHFVPWGRFFKKLWPVLKIWPKKNSVLKAFNITFN